jgi:hypothetical protein
MSLDRSIPIRFLRTAYHADDVVALAFRRLPDGGWRHRFLRVDSACADAFQRWLRHLNAGGHDLYVSMNTFQPGRRSRTEANLKDVRHVYLDFDSGGTEALAALRARSDLPPPSYVVHSSPGKFQTIWNVHGFAPRPAKALLRHLAHTLGADAAVHDLSRVLRLPGFRNYKYDPAPFVRLEVETSLVSYPPSAFPIPPIETPRVKADRSSVKPPGRTTNPSQSERDWAFVCEGLARRRPWPHLWRTLVDRRVDKPNPRFYASLTILNALRSASKPIPVALVDEMNAAQAHRPGPLSAEDAKRTRSLRLAGTVL